MHISKILTVNWGNIPNKSIKIEPSTLIYGTNGAGKSTILDAVQLVMTGSLKELCYFNRAGSENATTRSKKETHRDWLGYARGCDQGLVSRPKGGISYVAVTFEPEASEDAQGFTALLGCEFTGGENPDIVSKGFYLIRTTNLDYSDLVSDGKVKAIKEVKAQMLAVSASGFFKSYDTPTSYLTSLWNYIEGRPENSLSKEEAKRKTKNWTQLIGFQGAQDVATLVKDEILEAPSEKMKESILGLKDTMGQLKALEEEASRIKACIESLSEIDVHAKRAKDALFKASFLKLKGHQAQVTSSQEQLNALSADIEKLEQSAQFSKSKIEALDEQASSLSQQIKSKQAQLRFTDADVKNEALRNEIKQAELKAAEVSKALASLVNVCGFTANLVANLPIEGVSTDFIAKIKQSISRCRDELTRASPSAMSFADLESHTTALQKLISNESSMWKEIKAEEDKLNETLIPLRLKSKTLREQVEGAKLGNKFQPPLTYTQAKDLLKRELPQARARLLCEVSYIDDKKWQRSIEAYLAGNRFLFLVEEGFEAKAIDLLRQNGFNKAKVFQTNRAIRDYNPSRTEKEGVASKIRSQDKIARICIDMKFGATKCVQSTEEAKNERLAITAEGVVSSGYTMSYNELNKIDLYMTEGIDEQMLLELRADLERVEESRKEIEEQLKGFRELDLIKGKELGSPYATAAKWLGALTEVEGLKDDLTGSIEENGNDLLEKEIQILESEREKLYSEKLEMSSIIGRDGGKAYELKSKQSQLATQAEQAALNFKELANELSTAFFEGQSVLSHIQSCSEAWDSLAPNAKFEDAFYQSVSDIGTALAVYASKPSFSEIERLDKSLLDGKPSKDKLIKEKAAWLELLIGSIGEKLERQRNTGLAANQEKIIRIREMMDSTLSGTLAAQVVEQVNSIDRTLGKINLDLAAIKVGDNTYRFGSEFISEYKDYYEFFKLISETAEGAADAGSPQFQLFSGVAMDIPKELLAVKDRLVEILSSPDEVLAEKALLQITDYRLYKDYQLLRRADHGGEVNMAKENTGSGGQLQPAYYLVRCAILQKELGFRNAKQASKLRTVMMDEAFSRMDEHRIYDAMKLIESVMGFMPIMVAPQGRQDKMILSGVVDKALGFEKFHVEHGKAALVQIQEATGFREDKFLEAVKDFKLNAKKEAMLELNLEESDLAENL